MKGTVQGSLGETEEHVWSEVRGACEQAMFEDKSEVSIQGAFKRNEVWFGVLSPGSPRGHSKGIDIQV
jgi:hypothetical protein